MLVEVTSLCILGGWEDSRSPLEPPSHFLPAMGQGITREEQGNGDNNVLDLMLLAVQFWAAAITLSLPSNHISHYLPALSMSWESWALLLLGLSARRIIHLKFILENRNSFGSLESSMPNIKWQTTWKPKI